MSFPSPKPVVQNLNFWKQVLERSSGLKSFPSDFSFPHIQERKYHVFFTVGYTNTPPTESTAPAWKMFSLNTLFLVLTYTCTHYIHDYIHVHRCSNTAIHTHSCILTHTCLHIDVYTHAPPTLMSLCYQSNIMCVFINICLYVCVYIMTFINLLINPSIHRGLTFNMI